MKIARRYTKPGLSPFEGETVSVVPPVLLRGSGPFTVSSVEFPANWSTDSRAACLEICFVLDGIACDLVQIAEDDVPVWLWRHEPTEAGGETRGETGIDQVIDRICGGWTYQGWKGGYFDSEEDARIFYDECRWLLFHRKIGPSVNQWRHAGRYWAYGHDVSVSSTFVTDYRTGCVRRAAETDLPPYGLVINGVDDALAGEGGIWDLWRREAEILSTGGSCGANIGNFRPTGSTSGDTGIAGILAIGDSMVRTVRPGSNGRRPQRRLTIDGTHPDSLSLVRRPAEKMAAFEVGAAGSALARRHLQAIIDACCCPQQQRRGRKKPNPGLQLALQSARRALLPEPLIERTLKLVDAGLARTADEIIGNACSGAGIPASVDALTVVRLDGALSDETPAATVHRDRVLETVAVAAWSGVESGLHFDAGAEVWNTCPDSGQIRSASGDGSFMFLDDTASDSWFINAAAFLEPGSDIDIGGFQHAAEMLTIAADISAMTGTAVTPRLARRTWDFRPLSLSLTGLSQCLVASGLAYDGGPGRAMAAGLAALLTGTAYYVSAEMAAELGRFPAYADNADSMLRVLDRHSDMVATGAHESSPPGLVETVEQTWAAALRLGTREGFRNAQVSVLCADRDLATILDAGSPGLSPTAGLVCHGQSAGGYFEKTIDPAVPQGLRALGYDERQIDAIVRHIVGHGTLANAPGVNHETLRKRGFTQSAIDAVECTLSQAGDISLAFSPFVLGEDYCRHMLGFTGAELHDGEFDMLAALGFSDAGIEAANLFCCGADTMEGAPHVAPEHLAVFDCAEPQGARGARCVGATGIVRMMASLQPQISGAIGQTVPLPANASLDDCRAILALAGRLKLKSVTLKVREADAVGLRPAVDGPLDMDRNLPALTVLQGGSMPVRPAAHAMAKFAETGNSLNTQSGKKAVDGAQETARGAEASRRALPRAARSTASVPSSADAVSSNGMFDVASP